MGLGVSLCVYVRVSVYACVCEGIGGISFACGPEQLVTDSEVTLLVVRAFLPQQHACQKNRS